MKSFAHWRRTPVAVAGVVLDGDGREHHRHRRRGRGGTRQRNRIEVRADDVERALVEDEARARRDVRGRRQDHRALAAIEIAERGAVEQDFVVQLRRQLGPAPALRRQVSPVARTEGAGDELALHVALQEPLLVVIEELVAVQAVGQRREAAARNAGDDIDGIEQAKLGAVRRRDLGAPEELQHAIGERRRARPSARKSEDDQILLAVPALGLARLEAIAGSRVGLRDRRVHRPAGASAEQRQEKQHRQRGGEFHGRQLHRIGVMPGARRECPVKCTFDH